MLLCGDHGTVGDSCSLSPLPQFTLFSLFLPRLLNYTPYINRFLQPDSLVPGAGNPQNFNRYSYVGNNPVNFNDPSGHDYDCGTLTCPDDMQSDNGSGESESSVDRVLRSYGITTEGGTSQQKQAALLAAYLVGDKLSTVYGGTAADNFYRVHGDIHIVFNVDGMDGCKTDPVNGGESNVIRCGSNSYWLQTILHEFAHVFDNRYRYLSHWDDDNCDPNNGGCLASSYLPDIYQNAEGYFCDHLPCLAHDPNVTGYDFTEAFADMYMNWALDGLSVNIGLGYDTNQNGFDYSSQAGRDKSSWITTYDIARPSGIPAFVILMGRP